MKTTPDLIGKTFNQLTVIADGGRDKKMNVLWLCKCTCGGTTLQHSYDLRSGKVGSCGCIRRSGDKGTTHGYARSGRRRSAVYSVWATMVQRCTNPKDPNYPRYGGRGITVCNRWAVFENFLADMGEPAKGQTLERVNNALGYSAENCVWATTRTQNRNKRSNVWITIGDETKLQQDWLDELGVGPAHLHYYMKQGMSRESALERIISKKRH